MGAKRRERISRSMMIGFSAKYRKVGNINKIEMANNLLPTRQLIGKPKI